MPDQINTPAPIQETPNTVTQTVNTNAPIQNTESNKPFYKSFLFYLLIVIVLILVVIFSLLDSKGSLFVSKQENTGTAQYQSGSPLNSVTVQMPNDETIQRYPAVQPTIVGLNVYLNTFEGLVQLRGSNVVEPGLAVSWTNPNPTTWRFNLRKGVHFQSGDLFTAKDVKYTIDQCKASINDASPWVCQSFAALVDHVNIIDDYTVDLVTSEPNATLINSLYFIGMLSQAQIEKDGLNNAVGTGPYKIVSIASRQAKLAANDNYWDGAPKVKNLTYTVITDPDKAVQSLKNGSTDIIFMNDEKNHNDLLNEGFYESTYHTSGIDYIALDVNSVKSKQYVNTVNNPFHDVRVRNAIYLALNLPQIISDIKIDADPVTQFATPDLVGYNPSIKSSAPNLAEAKQLLAEAGFPNGFTVQFDTDSIPAHLKIVDQIKKELALIGITVKPEVPSIDDYNNRSAAGDYSMLINFYYPDTLDSRDILDVLLHTPVGSHGFYNQSKISDPKLDTLLDQAQSSYDIDTRIKLTQQAQALAMEDMYQIPLYTENYQVFARDDVAYKASINMLVLGIDLSGRQNVTGN